MTRLKSAIGPALILATIATCCQAQSAVADRKEPQIDLAAHRARMAKMVTDHPGFEMPANRPELDAALARNDLGKIGALSKAVSTFPDLQRMANWKRYAVFIGGGYFYAVDLFNMGFSRDAAALKFAGRAEEHRRAGAELKKTAAMMGVYAVALTLIDGERCSDPTAPVRQQDDIKRTLRDIWSHAASLSEGERATIVRTALMLEFDTAPLRSPDNWLCRGGDKERIALLETFSENLPAARPAPSRGGIVGKTYEVEVDPAKHPLFITDDAWILRQQKKRAELPNLLGEIVGVRFSAAAPR